MKLTNNIMGEYQALSEKNVKQTTSAIYSVHVVRFPYPFIYLNFEKGTPFGWSLPILNFVKYPPGIASVICCRMFDL